MLTRKNHKKREKNAGFGPKSKVYKFARPNRKLSQQAGRGLLVSIAELCCDHTCSPSAPTGQFELIA